MVPNRLCRMFLTLAGITAAAALPHPVHGQAALGAKFDEVVAPGANYDTAAFRLWYPRGGGPVRGIAVLVPGSNADGRAAVDDTAWQAFAVRHRLALVGCYFTDRPHDPDFVEEYVNVAKGSGEALLRALAAFAKDARHPEFTMAPLLLWGMSAGGEFNYEFVAWKPERVIAFVVNKGGIYYTALVPRAAREVPGLLFVGERDRDVRTKTVTGLFAVNRRAGALWALTEEPSTEHVVGRSAELSRIFFEDVLALRLDNAVRGTKSTVTLTALPEPSGFVGDLQAKTVQAIGGTPVPADHSMTAWLPTERVARAWRAVVTGSPLDSGIP